MKILMYHKNLCHSEQDILDRATQKKHMLRKTIYWDILLFLLAGIGGTLLFLYSPVLMKIPVFYAFVPVRNSIWENLKLLYMPAVLTGMIRYLFTGELQKGILTTYAQGISLTMLLFLTGHYFFTGIAGREFFPADMLIFYFCVIFLVWYLRTQADRQKKSSLYGFLWLILLTGCFFYFTFHPPVMGLFEEISLQQQ